MRELVDAGVAALKIEGRQRGRAYVAQAVANMRAMRDAALRGETPDVDNLSGLAEGAQRSAGAYQKAWQ
jgi:putative protease